jgi:hypothetical protein
MSARYDKSEMPKEDVKVLEAAQKIFNEMGLKADFEVSYGFGEGAYDFSFDTKDDYVDCLQIGWVNAKKATEEWGGYDGIKEYNASWSMYDENGHGLIDDDITEDFEVLVTKLKEIIGGDVMGNLTTIEGLRDYLNTLIEDGKGDYSVEDCKGVLLTQGHVHVNDNHKDITIDARLYGREER